MGRQRRYSKVLWSVELDKASFIPVRGCVWAETWKIIEVAMARDLWWPETSPLEEGGTGAQARKKEGRKEGDGTFQTLKEI